MKECSISENKKKKIKIIRNELDTTKFSADSGHKMKRSVSNFRVLFPLTLYHHIMHQYHMVECGRVRCRYTNNTERFMDGGFSS
jgi:hypothetical protein